MFSFLTSSVPNLTNKPFTKDLSTFGENNILFKLEIRFEAIFTHELSKYIFLFYISSIQMNCNNNET
jgi:hypothetical protein